MLGRQFVGEHAAWTGRGPAVWCLNVKQLLQTEMRPLNVLLENVETGTDSSEPIER